MAFSLEPFLFLHASGGASLQLWCENPTLTHLVGCDIPALFSLGIQSITAWMSLLVNKQELLDYSFSETFFEVTFLNVFSNDLQCV